MSSVSRIENWRFRPSALPSSRSSLTPSAWKVQISTSLAALPTSWRARFAHLGGGLVGEGDGGDAVGCQPGLDQGAILCVMTRVLPEPAPASTRHGPPRWLTASSWAMFRPADMGFEAGKSLR